MGVVDSWCCTRFPPRQAAVDLSEEQTAMKRNISEMGERVQRMKQEDYVHYKEDLVGCSRVA